DYHKHHLFHRHKDEENTGEEAPYGNTDGGYNTGNTGYNTGDGYNTGTNTGYDTGNTDGYNTGTNTGGYDTGNTGSYDTGYNTGTNTGYNTGTTEGYNTGYNTGTGNDNTVYNSGYVEEEKPDYEKQEKHAKRKEHLGELGAAAAGGFALYERHEAKKDPEHAHKHKIEEEILATAAVGAGGYAFHEKHEKKEFKKEEKEGEGGKKHHFFG
ncbi:hypothetical protein, partial [Acinetobacter indicus]|uniref:hypothetical protein n=1 Tax=Acinetobacter indicus TaxID=756892 RepID=UPI001C08134A